MVWVWRFPVRVLLAAWAASFITGIARAQGAAPAISGNGWIAIAIIAGLVAIIALMISGTIRISGSGTSDDDDGGAGFGVLEDIDEDEPRKR